MSRPVYVRAMRTAALIASAPVLRNCTRSAHGMTPQNRSATSTSRACDSPETEPLATVSITARVTLRLAVREGHGAQRHGAVEEAISVHGLDVAPGRAEEVSRQTGNVAVQPVRALAPRRRASNHESPRARRPVFMLLARVLRLGGRVFIRLGGRSRGVGTLLLAEDLREDHVRKRTRRLSDSRALSLHVPDHLDRHRPNEGKLARIR